MIRRLCHRRPKGQVLVYGMMIFIALLLMIIFLFDLQYFIRLRARTQNAVDAAVLTGAAWQGRTLNVIGEMNLLKATEMLLTDVPPYTTPGNTSAEDLAASVALLTEMQTRMAYVGPMVGYTACQQAAKHNGLRPVPEFTGHIEDHVETYFGPGGLYQRFAPSINNYNWYVGYGNMLERLAEEGLAAQSMNSRYLGGQPRLRGNQWTYLLMDPSFYSAVHARYYCWFQRRGIGPDQIDFGDVTFEWRLPDLFVGSEFLPVFVAFASSAELEIDGVGVVGDWLDDHQQYGTDIPMLRADQEGIEDIVWATYEGAEGLWEDEAGQGWAETDLYDVFHEYEYLRSDFRGEYIYSGAAARMVCKTRPAVLSGRWDWRYGQDATQPGAYRLGGQWDPATNQYGLQWSDERITLRGERQSFTSIGRRLEGAEQSLDSMRASETIQTVSAAKPLGALDADNDLPPHATAIILPVFHDVRLIPTSLVRENPMDTMREFYRFLIEYFGHPDYPNVPDDVRARYIYYISAIEQVMDPDSDFNQLWRDTEDGWNELLYGEDRIPDTEDDPDPRPRHPCDPPPARDRPRHPGPGPGPGPGDQDSRGGPPVPH